jgi:lipoprotein-anchoring transpeptidase ErfK/SrfK
VYARGCETWYEVSPRGFVCVDQRRATLDPSDAGFRELAQHPADYASSTPHHYAGSLGVERYLHLPALPEQHIREPDLTTHLQAMAAARSGSDLGGAFIGVDLSPAPEDGVDFAALPPEVQVQRHSLKRDSTLAYLGEYRHGERTFLLTADFAWVPKDRVRPFSPISFHGVELTGDTALPIAFFRIHDRPGFRKLPDGEFVPVADVFHRLEWVPLTGRQETVGNVTYVETKRASLWVRESDAVIPKPPEHTPWGSSMSAAAAAGAPRKTWIEVDVFGGWLLAYEGTKPIFTTLVSTGRGGVAVPAEDAAKTSSTPLGQFVVTGKFVTATMDGPTEVSHTDVPWVQNFSGPHSIHTAYWHDAWGERVSSGCVNVSPLDGKYLFEFTEPRVPPGWHAAVWDMHHEASTLVVVHR